ncbi:MAG: Holliday junction resolvase RuvX [Dehalococcoidia bacterium]|jgi:putative Holliday junction resolvase
MPRILGLDIGDRKIGVAVSDPSQVLASPISTIIRDDDAKAINQIACLTKKYGASQIIIGLPYSLSGAIGKQAEKVLSFKQKIAEAVNVEIIMQDERLSSVSANQKLREAGKKGNKLKNEMDAAAATVILQSFLDERKINRDSSAADDHSR